MSEVIFEFNGEIINIFCNEEEKMKEICKKLSTKIQIELNELLFLYNGNIINTELIFKDIINEDDKERKKMNILVQLINSNIINEKNIIKSKEIICPECKENAINTNIISLES